MQYFVEISFRIVLVYKSFCFFFRLWTKTIVAKDGNMFLKFHTRVIVYEICWFRIVLDKQFTKHFAYFFENTWFFSISDFGLKILLQRIAICFWNFTHECLFTRSVDSAQFYKNDLQNFLLLFLKIHDLSVFQTLDWKYRCKGLQHVFEISHTSSCLRDLLIPQSCRNTIYKSFCIFFEIHDILVFQTLD